MQGNFMLIFLGNRIWQIKSRLLTIHDSLVVVVIAKKN
jgi:hypothetical protein